MDAKQQSDKKGKAYRVPEPDEKNALSRFWKKTWKERRKKDGCTTGNPVKEGYIIMTCPRFLPKKAYRFDVREAHLFTENVKSTGKFTFYVKPESGICLKQKLARDML